MEKVIILIEHRPDYRALYGLNLNVYMGLPVKVATTVKEVADLTNSYDCCLIFVNNESYTIDIGKEVYEYIFQKHLSIPLYIIRKDKNAFL